MRWEKLIKGAKAGGYPGLLLGILSFPLNYYLLAIKYRQEISDALGKPYYPSTIGLMMNSIFSALILAFCGALYALFYKKLPFRKSFWKAFVFGFIIYMISRIGDLIVDYPISPSLTLENAIWSAPLLLLIWPYFTSKLYHEDKEEA